MTPDALIERASSARATTSNVFRGCRGLGSIWSIGISVCVSPAVGASPRSASRPRPSPRLFMPQNLLCQLEIGDGPIGSHIVQHDRTPMTGRLAQADVAWDDGLEDIPRAIPVDFVTDLQREARATIKHCQDNSEYAEAGIQPLTNELNSFYKV